MSCNPKTLLCLQSSCRCDVLNCISDCLQKRHRITTLTADGLFMFSRGWLVSEALLTLPTYMPS